MNVLVVTLAIALIALLMFKLWKPYMLPGPKRVVPQNEARLYFFYTEWCGFSKKAQPEWKGIVDIVGATPYFGKTLVTLVPVDGDKDKATAELYGVDAYPTIKLETRDGILEFKKGVKTDKLLQFLRESLGKESASL